MTFAPAGVKGARPPRPAQQLEASIEDATLRHAWGLQENHLDDLFLVLALAPALALTFARRARAWARDLFR